MQVDSEKYLDTRFAARFKQLYSFDDEYTFNRSTLFSFNQLVAKYIRQFYDVPMKKIYINTINNFANGVFNQSIVDFNFTYPDIAPLISTKIGDDEVYKYSSTKLLETNLSVDQNELDQLKNAVKSYIDIGVPGHESDNDHKKCIKMTNSDLTRNIGAPARPALTYNLQLHLYINAISQLLKAQLNPNVQVAGDEYDLLASIYAMNADANLDPAKLKLHNNGAALPVVQVPTFTEVINKICDNAGMPTLRQIYDIVKKDNENDIVKIWSCWHTSIGSHQCANEKY